MFDISQEDTNKKCNEIIDRLNRAGVFVKKGKKGPINGLYSGIIGCRNKPLELNIPVEW